MQRFLLGGIALAALAAAGSAAAEEIAAVPVHEATPVAVVASTGLFLWADGSWQRLNLPSVGLGLRNVAPSGLTDMGPVDVFHQRFDGYGLRGAVGYLLSPGLFPPGLGADARVEIGGSYVHADGKQSTGSSLTTTDVGLFNLDGSGQSAFICTGAFHCATASTLSTSYQSWQVNASVAGDFRLAILTLTPSAGVFGGEARNRQTLAQAFSQFDAGGAIVDAGAYDASTSLNWRDIGGRAGLDANLDLSSWFAVGAGASAGFANRRASLSGIDVGSSAPIAIFSGASAIASSGNATPLIANAELGLTLKPLPGLALRGFGGVNYDSKVPGIVGSSFSGPATAPTTRTPAGITFHKEYSYYAGGGAILRF